MAISYKSQGTQTASGSEDTLLSTTDLGTYVLMVDLGPMQNGDRTRIRIKQKIRSTGTQRNTYDVTYEHQQGQPIIYSPAVPCPQGSVFTLEQEAGTNRNYDWAVIRLDA